jgi:hypothetical protein
MLNQCVSFLEGTLVKEELDPFPAGQLALSVLFVNPGLTAALPVGFQTPVQGRKNISTHTSPHPGG